MHASIHPSIHLLRFLSIYLFAGLSIYLSIHPCCGEEGLDFSKIDTRKPVQEVLREWLPVHEERVQRRPRAKAGMSIYLSISIYLSVYLSVCLSVYLSI